MPDMDTVITNVISYITSNPASNGQEIIDGLSPQHKRHQVKQAIKRKFDDNTITAPAVAFVTNVFRVQPNNTKTILGIGSVHATQMHIISDDGNTITINDVIIEVKTADGNIRVKIYGDTAGDPDTLLGESNSTMATAGVMKISLIAGANIPAGGLFWVAIETDSATFELRTSIEASGNAKTVVHTYGTGPTPFGSVTNSTIVPKVGVETSENKIPRWYDADWSLV